MNNDLVNSSSANRNVYRHLVFTLWRMPPDYFSPTFYLRFPSGGRQVRSTFASLVFAFPSLSVPPSSRTAWALETGTSRDKRSPRKTNCLDVLKTEGDFRAFWWGIRLSSFYHVGDKKETNKKTKTRAACQRNEWRHSLITHAWLRRSVRAVASNPSEFRGNMSGTAFFIAIQQSSEFRLVAKCYGDSVIFSFLGNGQVSERAQ